MRQQTKQKRGEELAKMAAAFFALVLSLPVLSAPLLFPSSPPEGLNGTEDEAGKMADRRGAALLLVDRRPGAARWGGEEIAGASDVEAKTVGLGAPRRI